MAVKPFKIGQHVMMSEEGLRHHGEKYRNTVFKVVDICPVSFSFKDIITDDTTEPVIGEHFNDLVEIKDGKESDYLFDAGGFYDYELIDEAGRWK